MTSFNKKNILAKIDNLMEHALHERDKIDSKTNMELWKFHHGEFTSLNFLKSMIIHNSSKNDCLQIFPITKNKKGE